jgi:hypothetical protein
MALESRSLTLCQRSGASPMLAMSAPQ